MEQLHHARREYRAFMARMDVAFAFGSGCAIEGDHPHLRGLRAEADRLLTRIRTLEVAAGLRPLNPPGAHVVGEFSPN